MTPTEDAGERNETLPAARSRPGLLSRLEIAMIQLYKCTLSPFIGQHCRFQPTCSTYGIQALEKYGFLEANLRIAWRILRCNPFCRGGYDPA